MTAQASNIVPLTESGIWSNPMGATIEEIASAYGPPITVKKLKRASNLPPNHKFHLKARRNFRPHRITRNAFEAWINNGEV